MASRPRRKLVVFFFLCLLVKRHPSRYGHSHLHQSTRRKKTQAEDIYMKLSVKRNIDCVNDARSLGRWA